MNEIEIIRDIQTAIKSGDVQLVRSLIGDSQTRLRHMTPFGTWLHIAAKAGNLEMVKCLLDLGADVDAKGGTFGGTAINLAASAGRADVVRALLKGGAGLDTSEPERNPLFGAIYGGHIEIVKLLVEQGVDYSTKYSGDFMKDMDALAFALERGQSEIADYLAELDHGKNSNSGSQ